MRTLNGHPSNSQGEKSVLKSFHKEREGKQSTQSTESRAGDSRPEWEDSIRTYVEEW